VNVPDVLLVEVVDRIAGALAPRLSDALVACCERPAPEPWRLLDVDEVAATLGRSRRWVHGAVKERGLPFVRLDGGALAFDPEDVRAWARARRVPAAEPTPLATRLQPPRDAAPRAALDGSGRRAMQRAGRA
jgi:excisionase family DNA binding protein